jgi:hypothetical protein
MTLKISIFTKMIYLSQDSPKIYTKLSLININNNLLNVIHKITSELLNKTTTTTIVKSKNDVSLITFYNYILLINLFI